ncbi:hypothetical protein Dimus_015498 [Dionaea muscipula]
MDVIDGVQRSGSTGIVDLSPRSGEAIDLTGHVHHLPCCVKFTGATSVSHYFKPKTTDAEVDGLVVEEAFFRGRKLQGTTIDLPEGYSGFVMGKISFGQDKVRKAPSKGKSSAMLDGNMNSWEMLTKYRKITVWNHESFLSQDDAFLRSFHWFAVSKAVRTSLASPSNRVPHFYAL